MADKYILQIVDNSTLEIVRPEEIIAKENCMPDYDFLKTQLAFTYNVINGKSLSSLDESNIIGRQIWKSIAEKTLDFQEKFNLFKLLQSGLKDNITMSIAYADVNMKFECSIPWELLAFTQGNQTVFLYESEKVNLIRKYAGSKNKSFNAANTLPENEIFEAPCRMILYVDGAVNAKEKKGTVLDDEEKAAGKELYELIQFETVKNKLAELANTINRSKAANPYEEDNRDNLLQLKFIQSDFNTLLKTIEEWKPNVVHIITHGKWDDESAGLLLNESGLRLDWQPVDKVAASLGNCGWHVPVYVLEICHAGRSNFPLQLSSLGAKIVAANMFKINQQLSQTFYSGFYADIFAGEKEKRRTFIKAFQDARRKNFKPSADKSLSHYGLPVLYYNFEDVERERIFFEASGGKGNKPAGGKAGGEAKTEDDLFNEYYYLLNDKLKGQNLPVDKMAIVAVRTFISFINSDELIQRYPAKQNRLILLSKWNDKFPVESPLYDFMPENYKSIFEKFYDDERFQNIAGAEAGIKTQAQQTNITGRETEFKTEAAPERRTILNARFSNK